MKKTNKDPSRRIKILDFITTFGEKNHRSPTVKEIMKAVELSSLSSVWHHLELLGFAMGKGRDSWWRQNKIEFIIEYGSENGLFLNMENVAVDDTIIENLKYLYIYYKGDKFVELAKTLLEDN